MIRTKKVALTTPPRRRVSPTPLRTILAVVSATVLAILSTQITRAQNQEPPIPSVVLGNLYVASTIPGNVSLKVGDEFSVLVLWRTPSPGEAGCLPVRYGQPLDGPLLARVMIHFPREILQVIELPANNITEFTDLGLHLECGKTGTSLFTFRVREERPEWWRNETEEIRVYIPQPVQTSPEHTLALAHISIKTLTFKLAR